MRLTRPAAVLAVLVTGCATLPARHADAEWSVLSGPLFSAAGPVVDDVFQGELSDCSVMALLAGLAWRDPNGLRDRIAEQPDGTFAVTLRSGVEIVDRRFPTRNGRLLYAGDAPQPFFAPGARGPADRNDKPIWPMVLEKAVAQHAGGYAAIDRERFDVVAELAPRTIELSIPKRGPKQIEAILREALALGLVVRMGNAPQSARAQGLTPGHAYAALGIDDGLLVLRNPAGVGHQALPVADALRTFRHLSLSGADLERLRTIRVGVSDPEAN